MTLPSKSQADNFLRNELRKKAQERGLTVLPAQAQVNLSEVAKVKVKNATSRRP